MPVNLLAFEEEERKKKGNKSLQYWQSSPLNSWLHVQKKKEFSLEKHWPPFKQILFGHNWSLLLITWIKSLIMFDLVP